MFILMKEHLQYGEGNTAQRKGHLPNEVLEITPLQCTNKKKTQKSVGHRIDLPKICLQNPSEIRKVIRSKTYSVLKTQAVIKQ